MSRRSILADVPALTAMGMTRRTLAIWRGIALLLPASCFAQGECPEPPNAELAGDTTLEVLRQFDLDRNGQIDPGCESGRLRDRLNATFARANIAKSNEALEPAPFKEAVYRLDAYEPVYFVVGDDARVGLNGKFQISFDYKLFRDDEGVLGKVLPADELHLSYSQTSLWNFSESSGPFRDTSYRPRLFYRPQNMSNRWGGRMKQLDVGVGHESNGLSGRASRSIDIAFIRPTFAFGDATARSGRQLFIRPTIYTYLEDSENPDIRDYRGHVDLEIGFNWYVGAGTSEAPWRAWTTLRKGNRSNFGSIEANLAVALASLSDGRLNGWLLFQYFNGYGEDLLAYDRKLGSQMRAGLAVMF